jgi:hypothetical protein
MRWLSLWDSAPNRPPDQAPDRYSYVSQRAAAARGTGHQGVHQRRDGRTALFEQRKLQLGLDSHKEPDESSVHWTNAPDGHCSNGRQRLTATASCIKAPDLSSAYAECCCSFQPLFSKGEASLAGHLKYVKLRNRQGSCGSTLVLSTCIVSNETLVISVGVFWSA